MSRAVTDRGTSPEVPSASRPAFPPAALARRGRDPDRPSEGLSGPARWATRVTGRLAERLREICELDLESLDVEPPAAPITSTCRQERLRTSDKARWQIECRPRHARLVLGGHRLSRRPPSAHSAALDARLSGAAASDRPAGPELIPSPDRLPPTGPTLLEKGTDIHRWTNGHLWRESVGTGPLRQAEGRDSAPSKPQGRRTAASVPASHPRQSMQTNTPKTDQGAAPPGPPHEVRR